MAHLGQVTFLVHDYDDALAFFVDALGFSLIEDTDLGRGKRWVVVAPDESSDTRLLLARAADDTRNGQPSERRPVVAWRSFLHTDDFARAHTRMTAAGVTFCEPPRDEPYGKVAVFEDLYGNRWDLIEPRT